MEIPKIINHAPLFQSIAQMGLAVASAQAALDEQSINSLVALAEKTVDLNGDKHSLLALGFVPSFYAFTEASFELKMEFHMAESEAFAIGAGLAGAAGQSSDKSAGMMAIAVNLSYSRRFDQSVTASSSIAARLVSLPPPENLLNVLKANSISAT